MNQKRLLYKVASSYLFGFGPIKTNLLFAKLGDIEPLFELSDKRLAEEAEISPLVVKKMKRKEALQRAEQDLRRIEGKNVKVHFIQDPSYPRRLKQCVDAPLVVYSSGTFETNPTRSVAIVGTRSATRYGLDLCQELVGSLMDANVQVISGLAHGIDACAHRTCVEQGIETVGVLGHGLDKIYPSVHRDLASQMLEKGGLITEYPVGIEPEKEYFPMRNRIVAGMADAVIVVESKDTGGSLITARLANEYNRDVFAFPGNIGQSASTGCNLLLRETKAQIVLGGTDFLDQMNWKGIGTSFQRTCLVELTEPEKKIQTLLADGRSEHIDVLSFQSKIPISNMNVLLFQLEMKGVIKQLPGKMIKWA